MSLKALNEAHLNVSYINVICHTEIHPDPQDFPGYEPISSFINPIA